MRKTLTAAALSLALAGWTATAAANPPAAPVSHPEGEHHEGDKGADHHEGDHHEAEKPAH